ncbi:MAG: hypothetical protein M3463_03885 [Verrucomicrobiota bacterium]|nr:hypothetical protein [Verrucomicrobiota bacterium]
MRAFYNAWWAELEPTFAHPTEIHLGHPDHPLVSLTGHDWIQEALPPWSQRHIRSAEGFGPARGRAAKGRSARAEETRAAPAKSAHQGHWAVKVVTPGTYEISLRRWPMEADRPITAALPPGADVPGATKAFRAHEGVAIPAITAALRLDGRELETKPVNASDTEVRFTVALTVGSHQLAPAFITADGHEVGAYYAVITKQR